MGGWGDQVPYVLLHIAPRGSGSPGISLFIHFLGQRCSLAGQIVYVAENDLELLMLPSANLIGL